MAIDDVVSSIDNQIADGASLAVQPLSGDEWLVTGYFFENAEAKIRASADSGDMLNGSWGGTTDTLTTGAGRIALHPVNHLLTNSDYITLVNTGPGATLQFGFSAIKTKE